MRTMTVNRDVVIDTLKKGAELKHYFSTETARLDIDGMVIGAVRWDTVNRLFNQGLIRISDTNVIYRKYMLTEKGRA